MQRRQEVERALALIAAVAVAASALAWMAMPADVRVPVHWGIDGSPDRWGGRWQVALSLPVVLIAMAVGARWLGRTPAGETAIVASPHAWRAGWIGAGLVVLVAHLGMVALAAGLIAETPLPVVIASAALMIVWIGNAVAKSAPNRVTGVRTRATLSDPAAWSAANRLAGWTLVLTGLVVLALTLAGLVTLAAQALIAGAVATAVVAALAGLAARRRS
ncbi:DUF1648 domain-containing protein [Rhodobacteraceae bacterium CCMM004]|nr:DUF1648 domain-containing protein [Rhodobacteraceae bacterium CCMM004]